MTVFAHISDLHFGRHDPRIVQRLKEILQSLEPDLVVISGDLTQRARSEEYRAGRDFLRSLALPYFVIPGNHDISAFNLVERFGYPWRKWYRYIGSELEPERSEIGYRVAGINTARRLGGLFNWSRGRISMLQSNRVKRLFAGGDADKLQIVAAHHPFWLPDLYEHRHLIGGRDGAVTVFRQAGVDLILSGHVHFTYTHLLQGIIVSHAGTATSTRLMPNSVNSFKVVKGNRQQLKIETVAWIDRSFQTVETEILIRENSGWVRFPTNTGGGCS